MLQAKYLSVLEARDRAEFRDAVIGFAQDLGFQTATAMAVIDHSLGDSQFITIDNSPRGYQEFFQNLEIGRRDPVMQHCKRQSFPIVWNQETYVEKGLGELWEEQARFGYRTGIAVALHLPEGRHFLLGVDRDEALPSDAAELTRVVADLQLFVVHAQDSALRLLVPVDQRPERPLLTPRELDTLRWTMDGKTAWEVGTIMGITERTVVHHVQNAMQKLRCTTKHQAVLKALRLGLLS